MESTCDAMLKKIDFMMVITFTSCALNISSVYPVMMLLFVFLFLIQMLTTFVYVQVFLIAQNFLLTASNPPFCEQKQLPLVQI